jgi:release factor glutamine methyltransferase
VFVQTNTVRATRDYFKNRLRTNFSENEIKLMFKELALVRLNLDRNDYLNCDNQLLSESDLLYFRSVVNRLLADEPFQYILGETLFYGLVIRCDSRALIPRPETEELVDWITEFYTQTDPIKLVDIGTGSGCIALALKSYFSKSEVIAVDISVDALELAKENATLLASELEFIQMDALKSDLQLEAKLQNSDIWVSNPPYIPLNDKVDMGRNVLDFEPHLALFVGNDDPLIFYREIGKKAFRNLKVGGLLFFEIHEEMGDNTADLLHEIGFVSVEIKVDLQGKKRMVKAQKQA